MNSKDDDDNDNDDDDDDDDDVESNDSLVNLKDVEMIRISDGRLIK